MTLRSADAWEKLQREKAQKDFKASFQDSNSNAIIETNEGVKRFPVLINDQGRCVIRIDGRLFDAPKYPGFQRYELKPEELTAPTDNRPHTEGGWLEQRRAAEQKAQSELLSAETTMKGRSVAAAIRNKKGWERILDPIQDVSEADAEKDALATMSADEYNKKFPYRDPFTQAFINARTIQQMTKAVNFFLEQHPEFARTASNREKLLAYLQEHDLLRLETPGVLDEVARILGDELETTDAVSQGRITKLVDLGGRDRMGQPSGYPEYFSESGKTGFRRLVASMSSAELADRCRTDPQFGRAVDQLNNE